MGYRCSLCVGFIAASLRMLLNHLSRNHKSDPNFHVLCGLDGCSRTYRRYLSFRNHLIRKHGFNLSEEQILDVNNDFDNRDQQQNEGDIEIPDELNGNPQADPVGRDPGKIRRDNSLCLLGFKEKGCVPQTVVDLFVDNSTQLVRNSIQIVEAEVREKLRGSGIEFDGVPGLNEIFNEESLAMNPFNGIQKEAKQYKFYKEHFNLVVRLRV